METFTHREPYLQAAASEIRGWFSDRAEVTVPQVRISTGWSKRGGKAIGWCWHAEAAADGLNQIFISPELADPKAPQGVLATLVHEMIHASDDGESKHTGHFRRTALAIGLEGRMTATSAGPGLLPALAELADTLGDYPHAALTPTKRIGKQGTRMLKLECPDCGWSARTTRKWILYGLPTCSCGTPVELVV